MVTTHVQSKWQKGLMTLLIIGLVAVSSLNLADEKAHQLINQAMLSAAGSYTIARTLDAAISTLQSSEVSAGVFSIDIGQVLNPVSDLINKFSDIMVMSFTSLSLQKVLLLMLSSTAANVIFALFAAAYLLTMWAGWAQQWRSLAQRLFHIMAIGRFLVLLAVLSSQCIDWWFINPQIEQYQQRVAALAHESEQSSYPVTAAEEKTEHSFLSFLQQLQQQWEQLTHDVAAQKDKLAQLADIAESSVVDLMTLMALYLLKTLILPLLLVFLCRMGLSRLFTTIPVNTVDKIPSN